MPSSTQNNREGLIISSSNDELDSDNAERILTEMEGQVIFAEDQLEYDRILLENKQKAKWIAEEATRGDFVDQPDYGVIEVLEDMQEDVAIARKRLDEDKRRLEDAEKKRIVAEEKARAVLGLNADNIAIIQ